MEQIAGRDQPSPSEVPYPPAPWRMVGQQWLSLFRLRDDVDERRPAGVYVVAWVSYEEGSPLTYHELLVARPVRSGEAGAAADKAAGRRVTITDIWVDSPESVAGGRALWAIPKGLCDFDLESAHRGPLTQTTWSASAQRRPIASARFTDVSRAALRVPFRGGTWQPPIDGGTEPKYAELTGSGRTLPCRGRWTFDRGGPLGWLADARQLASFRMAGFRMSFA